MQAGWKVGPGKTGGGVLQDRVCSAEAERVRGRVFGAGQQDADCAGEGGMGKESGWARKAGGPVKGMHLPRGRAAWSLCPFLRKLSHLDRFPRGDSF